MMGRSIVHSPKSRRSVSISVSMAMMKHNLGRVDIFSFIAWIVNEVMISAPTDRLWMGDVSMGSNSETIHFEGVETPTTYETLFK